MTEVLMGNDSKTVKVRRYQMRIQCTYCPTISMTMEFTTTKKGARSLLHDGYRYTINRRTADGQTYWRCFDRTCGGRAVTDVNDCLVSANNNHNHPPDVVEVAVQKIKEEIKERSKAETTPIPRIYHDFLQEVNQHILSSEIAAILPTFQSIRSSLYRKRRENHPPMPATADKINFDGEWSQTLNGEKFMLGSRDVFWYCTL